MLPCSLSAVICVNIRPIMNEYWMSQHDARIPEELRSSACGITCLMMAMRMKGCPVVHIPNFISEALALGAKGEKGWIHDKLVIHAHNYGIPAYRAEYKTMPKPSVDPEGTFSERMREKGVEKIQEELCTGRFVIASVPNPKSETDSHLVLLTGFNKGVFTVFDPAHTAMEEGIYQLSVTDFKTHWRRLMIVVG